MRYIRSSFDLPHLLIDQAPYPRNTNSLYHHADPFGINLMELLIPIKDCKLSIQSNVLTDLSPNAKSFSPNTPRSNSKNTFFKDFSLKRKRKKIKKKGNRANDLLQNYPFQNFFI